MVKELDVAVSKTLSAAKDGSWKPGTTVLGIAEGGVDLAFDDDNAPAVTSAMRGRVDQAKADIVSGKLKIHDYMTDNSCPD